MGEAKRNNSEGKAKVAEALRAECHRQVDEFLVLTDPETGEVMLDILLGMLAHDYLPAVTIEMRHPLTDEDPEQRIEVVRA
jgi:hypothetical protein